MKYISALFLVGLLGLLYREYHFIASEQINAWTQAHQADCAVVVTGGPGRVREGFDLLFREHVKKLIISGVHPSSTVAEIFPHSAYYGGFDKQDVILERYSGTTYGNARQSWPLVEALGCQSIVLVTSRLHMYRTKRTFFATYPEGFEIKTRAIGELDQSQSNLALLSETTKSLFYSLWAY